MIATDTAKTRVMMKTTTVYRFETLRCSKCNYSNRGNRQKSDCRKNKISATGDAIQDDLPTVNDEVTQLLKG
jgi:hypothetical protein